MSDDELIGRMLDELSHTAPVHLTIGAKHALYIANALMRAGKLPIATPDARRAYTMIREHIRLHFHDRPAVLEALKRGIDGIRSRP
jgi:hypothetical protein